MYYIADSCNVHDVVVFIHYPVVLHSVSYVHSHFPFQIKCVCWDFDICILGAPHFSDISHICLL